MSVQKRANFCKEAHLSCLVRSQKKLHYSDIKFKKSVSFVLFSCFPRTFYVLTEKLCPDCRINGEFGKRWTWVSRTQSQSSKHGCRRKIGKRKGRKMWRVRKSHPWIKKVRWLQIFHCQNSTDKSVCNEWVCLICRSSISDKSHKGLPVVDASESKCAGESQPKKDVHECKSSILIPAGHFIADDAKYYWHKLFGTKRIYRDASLIILDNCVDELSTLYAIDLMFLEAPAVAEVQLCFGCKKPFHRSCILQHDFDQ